MSKSNLKLLGRLGLILTLVCGLDAVAVTFIPRPLPWVILISFLLPTLNLLFVLAPVIKQSAQQGGNPSSQPD